MMTKDPSMSSSRERNACAGARGGAHASRRQWFGGAWALVAPSPPGRRPARPRAPLQCTHLVLLLGRERLHVPLARPQLEAKQRGQHALLRRRLARQLRGGLRRAAGRRALRMRKSGSSTPHDMSLASSASSAATPHGVVSGSRGPAQRGQRAAWSPAAIPGSPVPPWLPVLQTHLHHGGQALPGGPRRHDRLAVRVGGVPGAAALVGPSLRGFLPAAVDGDDAVNVHARLAHGALPARALHLGPPAGGKRCAARQASGHESRAGAGSCNLCS